jgi:hypothetical protein
MVAGIFDDDDAGDTRKRASGSSSTGNSGQAPAKFDPDAT